MSQAFCPCESQVAVVLLTKYYQVPCGFVWVSGELTRVDERLIHSFLFWVLEIIPFLFWASTEVAEGHR